MNTPRVLCISPTFTLLTIASQPSRLAPLASDSSALFHLSFRLVSHLQRSLVLFFNIYHLSEEEKIIFKILRRHKDLFFSLLASPSSLLRIHILFTLRSQRPSAIRISASPTYLLNEGRVHSR